MFRRWLLAPVLRKLDRLHSHFEELIMATKQEALERPDSIDAGLTKVGNETAALVKEVADLKEAAQNAGVDSEVMDRINAVSDRVTAIDDLVADVAPEQPEEPSNP